MLDRSGIEMYYLIDTLTVPDVFITSTKLKDAHVLYHGLFHGLASTRLAKTAKGPFLLLKILL